MEHLPNEIFAHMSELVKIDHRVLRLVSKRFQELPHVGEPAVSEFAGCIRNKYHELAEWYYHQVDKCINLNTLYINKRDFLANYASVLPLYIYQDHIHLAISSTFLTSYIEKFGLIHYIETLMTLNADTQHFTSSDQFCHIIACKMVYKCSSVENNYLTMMLLVGLMNAPNKIIEPVISNSDYVNQFSLNQVRSLAFMALCRGNITNFKIIGKLYSRNKLQLCSDLALIGFYMDVIGDRATINILMKNLYDDLIKADIYPVYNTHIYYKYHIGDNKKIIIG
ncbi:hypothetical protein F-liban_323 [Faustovirus]|nr:hypothetical protein F-liban_323 [Faustovirus]SME65012.1 Hypothetical protein FSTVST1_315 [Faustovirus ST1]